MERNELEIIHEPDTYRTGVTKPSKSRRFTAILLVSVIVLCGAVSLWTLADMGLLMPFLHVEQEEPAVVSSNAEGRELTDATLPAAANAEYAAITMHPTDTQAEPLSLQDIYARNIDAVVSITAMGQNGGASGTGVILSREGLVVTNCHVVQGRSQIEVLLTDGRKLAAAVIGKDPAADLAVLRISAEDLVAAELGDSSTLRVGDTMVAIGDPLGVELRGTMTDGIVSAINRDIQVDGRTMSVIQHNAALNAGNSGGPLINCYGQVVGINTMKMADSASSAGVEGLGFAIPSSTVVDVVNQLLQQGHVSGQPHLGLEGQDVEVFYQVYYGMPYGLYIDDVEEGSSADQAGIRSGDVLMSMDGVRISGADSFREQLSAYRPGDNVSVVIYRYGLQYNITLTVGEAQN